MDELTTTTFANPVYEHADSHSTFEEFGGHSGKFETIDTGKRWDEGKLIYNNFLFLVIRYSRNTENLLQSFLYF